MISVRNEKKGDAVRENNWNPNLDWRVKEFLSEKVTFKLKHKSEGRIIEKSGQDVKVGMSKWSGKLINIRTLNEITDWDYFV